MNVPQNEAPPIPENPFFHRGPIRDPAYFYNRKKEVKQALEMLGKSQSVSVIGPRKIGKTSLLLYISQPEVMRQHGLDPTHYLFVYFNCEGLSNLDREALYVLILEEIVKKAAQQGYDFAVPEHPKSHIIFERALGDILNRKLRLALLFDEFESLSKNHNLGSEFFSGLRALTTRPDVAYVTASKRPLLGIHDAEEYSPFFNIFVPLKLNLFDRAESRELIEGSIRKAEATLHQEVISRVLDLGGGHPFFLQVAGYWALELQATKGAPLEGKDFYILAQTVGGQVESHFEYYWGHLTPQEQYVLAALPFTQTEETYREQLEALAHLCLIVKEGGQYRYFSPLFGDFVRRQTEAGVEEAHEVKTEEEIRKEGEAAVSEEISGAKVAFRSERFVVLDAALTAFFSGALFAMALALLSNYTPLFWFAGFLALAFIVLLLMRFILSRRSQGGSH